MLRARGAHPPGILTAIIAYSRDQPSISRSNRGSGRSAGAGAGGGRVENIKKAVVIVHLLALHSVSRLGDEIRGEQGVGVLRSPVVVIPSLF